MSVLGRAGGESSRARPEARFARLLITLAILFGLTATAPAGEIFPRDQMAFPFAPAAMADGPNGLRFNPGAIGTDPELAINYYHSYSDSSFNGDDGVYTALKGFGFGIEWIGSGSGYDGRSYTVGYASSGQRPFAIGGTYQWRSSDDPVQNKSHFWSYGFLWRPNNLVSFAGVANNHNRMKTPEGRSDAEFVYSGAIRMLKGRMTVGGDWYQRTSQNVWDGTYRIAASFEATPGLTLYTDMDEDKQVSVGARMNMSTWFVGSHNHFDADQEYRGGVGYVGLHKTRAKPLWPIARDIATIELSGDIPDRRPPRRFFAPDQATTLDFLTALDKVRHDPEIRAVVLRIHDPELGWARREELRRAVKRIHDAGKPTIAYLSGMVSNGEYYIATACDKIVVSPVATVDVVGLRSEITFAKRLLDKLGIVADLEHVGAYKSASDLLTRTTMSPEHRVAINALLDGLDAQWVAEIANGREVPTETVRSWIDHGPYVSVDAHDAGLVDSVAYADEMEGIVRAASGRYWRTLGVKELNRRTYARSGWAKPPQVAVIFAEGSIEEGPDREGLFTGEVMGSGTISGAIRRAREDKHVKALVLRVNSGGGSIFASDEIWREVQRTSRRKPIVVSFGDVAASGGYYIACAADSIFAMPNTITGSIGVISGKLDLSGLYDKVGLDKEILTRGRFANIYSSDSSFNDEERAVIRSQMMRAYEHFVDLVADGRRLPTDSVNAIAQGRVWSGAAAQDRGLVDRFADLHECIFIAARAAGIKPGEDVDVVQLPERRWQLFDVGGLSPLAAMLPGAELAEVIGTLLDKADILEASDGPTYEFPYHVTVR